jgi:uncharacterized protein YfaT (DUF1175 family)
MFSSTAKGRVSGSGIALCAVLAILTVLLLLRLLGPVSGLLHRSYAGGRHSSPVVLKNQTLSLDLRDRFGDGLPDGLRLEDPADQAAFRRWFTLIAEYQAVRPKADVPGEITDCASLLRYAYRESLKRHDAAWFTSTGIEVPALVGEIHAWRYPDTPLGLGLFRVVPGPFQLSDVGNGAFAQFADAKTLVEYNAYPVGRDVRMALPGDLLFYRQFGHSSPWHSMIVTRVGRDAQVVYDTGPDHGQLGELRRVMISDLVDHPQPEWRPVFSNPNFLGVYRWNILRGIS